MTEGLKFDIYFSKDTNPYDSSFYERRNAVITDDSGNVIESLEDIMVPKIWSQHALNTVATKYFRKEGIPETGREIDVRQLVSRVVDTITDWGKQQNYFDDENAENFRRELACLCLNQYGSFNSPTWFNLGLNQKYGITHEGDDEFYHFDHEKQQITGSNEFYEHPLVSACFISSPEDSIESMVNVGAIISARIFKAGAGIGGDWSKVRSAGEYVSGGGYASGATRFQDVQDSVGRVIKSGGKTRRAATMQTISVNHPDVIPILAHKYKEEYKGKILVNAGSPSRWEEHTWQDLRAQNVNISIRVTDQFMEAVEQDELHYFVNVLDGQTRGKLPARHMLKLIAYATHQCGDPAIQYHDEINRWNTCPNSGTIESSNPCSEYMFLNNSACNLASLNLAKFKDESGKFDVESFKRAVDIFITAQDIVVSLASYPTKEIAENSHIFRPLGLGYANLGSLIMEEGLSYDSEEARSLASAITSMMTGEAYLQSTKLARNLGTFQEFGINREPMLRVIQKHRDASKKMLKNSHRNLEELITQAQTIWDETLQRMEEYGARNAQVTLLAPTGTIGFMMDCDTTGCEPEFSLKKYKELAGGGSMKIVNTTVKKALQRLGYSNEEIGSIVDYIDKNETIEGCEALNPEHLQIFDCAVSSGKGTRSILPEGHLRMLGAIQPHLSGAISKTINCPEDTTVEQIEDMYRLGNKLRLKAVAIYRDESKGAQPLTTKRLAEVNVLKRGEREKLPALRYGLTQKVKITGENTYSLFIRTGEYPDGRLGEVFVDCLERGSEVNRLLNELAVQFSEKLQYGVPLVEALEILGKAGRSQLSGFIDHDYIKMGSIEGFLCEWLRANYLGDISTISKKDPELRPLPWELRTYQRIPELHLIPTVKGISLYPGVPSLEDTIKKVSDINYWEDKEDGLDTRETIERIKRTRIWKADRQGREEEKTRGITKGRVCDKCGELMISDGNCYKCPHCKISTGGCGGG